LLKAELNAKYPALLIAEVAMLFAGRVKLLFIVVPLDALYDIPVSDEFILFIVLFKLFIWP
jgi:hypothetical protein